MTNNVTNNGLAYDYAVDVQRIEEEFRWSLKLMENQGLRMTGRGSTGSDFSSALLNNVLAHDSWVSSFTNTDYFKCYDQARFLANRLNHRLTGLNLKWIFVMAERPGHYWVEAIPTLTDVWSFDQARSPYEYNKAAETPLPQSVYVLVLDPWLNRTYLREQPSLNIVSYIDELSLEHIFFKSQ